MDTVQTLIDKALPLCGWKQKGIAERIGAKESHVSAWRHGKKKMPPGKYYEIARIVYPEEDAKAIAREYLIACKMPPGFKWLLRLGNVLKSRT